MSSTDSVRITGLGARVHLFLRPDDHEPFVALFRDTLGCRVVERDFGLAHPIVLIAFPDGSAFSVEISDLAPGGPAGPIGDASAFRGAWIEFRTSDLEAVQRALQAAGVPEFRHPGSPHRYFSAPGGQVFRILDQAYRGP